MLIWCCVWTWDIHPESSWSFLVFEVLWWPWRSSSFCASGNEVPPNCMGSPSAQETSTWNCHLILFWPLDFSWPVDHYCIGTIWLGAQYFWTLLQNQLYPLENGKDNWCLVFWVCFPAVHVTFPIMCSLFLFHLLFEFSFYTAFVVWIELMTILFQVSQSFLCRPRVGSELMWLNLKIIYRNQSWKLIECSECGVSFVTNGVKIHVGKEVIATSCVGVYITSEISSKGEEVRWISILLEREHLFC